MTADREKELSAASYARRIGERWSRLLGRPVVLSPREWSLVSDWYAREIPLEIVHEAMAAATLRARGGRRPLRLSYLAPLVEESWHAVAQGRLATELNGRRVSPDPVQAHWRRRLRLEPAASNLRDLLEGLLEQLAAGEPPGRLDRELDRRLAEAVPPELLDDVRAELADELENFRSRMTAERFEATLKRASVQRLRRRLDLPRLESARRNV